MKNDTKIALGFSFVAVGMLVLLLIVLLKPNTETASNTSTVQTENGIQVVEVFAKGGYTPSSVQAMAGVPTELRVRTNGTYDCSAALLIPALGYETLLKPTGTEIITIAADQATGTIEGVCAMGMYRFAILFEEKPSSENESSGV